MKVLIWFLCIFANALITTLIKEAGVILGGIPTALMFAATLWLARTLCKKWDEHKGNKSIEENGSVQGEQSAPNVNREAVHHNNSATYIDGWQCSCGRTHPRYETSCICGKSKFDNIAPSTPETTDAELPQITDKVLFCRKCGEKLIDNSQFCCKCGTQIVKE